MCVVSIRHHGEVDLIAEHPNAIPKDDAGAQEEENFFSAELIHLRSGDNTLALHVAGFLVLVPPRCGPKCYTT